MIGRRASAAYLYADASIRPAARWASASMNDARMRPRWLDMWSESISPFFSVGRPPARNPCPFAVSLE
jgi:hypothetical protein